MRNYTDKILIELVGATNYFQYENKIFSAIYKHNIYDTIKSKVLSLGKKYEDEIKEDLNLIGFKDYFIKISDSDNHNGCKRIVFIDEIITKEKLVYKSKHLNSEPKIIHLFKKINKLFINSILITPEVFCAKHGYFSEYVESENNTDLTGFLLHLGQLLPFVKILGISDLHIENIVIKNNKICIVDYESILNYSSLRIEILKNFNSCSSLFDEFSILDSLLINPKGNGFEIDELIKVSFNLDEFCLSNEKYSSIIIEGIQKSILDINKNKEAFLHIINEEFKSEISSRFILRPTIFYSSIIKKYFSSLHNLASYEDLKNKIHSLLHSSNEFVPYSIIESEVDSLLIGDIPVFYLINNELIVNNETIYRFDNISILNIIQNEVNSVTETKDDYINYFKLKDMFLNNKSVFKFFSFKKIISCDNAGLNDSRLNYMGIDLYSGFPGYTLAYFHDKTKFREIYTNYLSLIEDPNNKAKLTYISLGGAYEGLISFLYYLLIILNKYKDEKVIEFVEYHLIDIIKSKLQLEKPKYELMNGLYGQISILDKYQTTFNNLVFDKFISQGLQLNYNVNDVGLAHGIAGQLLMEIRLSNKYFNIDRIKNLQDRIIQEFSFHHHNWKDIRTGNYDSYYWCNGGLGISLVLKESMKFNSSEKLSSVLDSFETYNKEVYVHSHLCCGEGIFLINNKYELKTDNFLNEERMGFYNLSFFTGRSGLEYFKHSNLNLLLLE
jgi:lantibiotic modifying enzyme